MVFSAMSRSPLSHLCEVESTLGDCHVDLFRFGCGRLRHRHGQETMLILSLDLIRINFDGEFNRADKLTYGAFAAMKGFWFDIVRVAPLLAREGQHIAHNGQ